MHLKSSFSLFSFLLLTSALSLQARQNGYFQSGRGSYSLRDPNAMVARYIDENAWRPVPGISDREYWTKAASSPGAAELIQLAAKKEPPSPLAKDKQMDLLYQISIQLPVACLTGKDSDVKQVLQIVQQLLDIEDWRSPEARENGSAIDNRASLTAVNLCWARILLEDKMPRKLSGFIDRRIRYEILDPLSQMVSRERKSDPWVTDASLENVFCSTDCSTLVLLQQAEPQFRYDLLRWLLPISLNYLDSLGGGDGFESEGSRRWNQGFSAYLDQALVYYLATDKKLDLLKRKSAINAADYPEMICLLPGYYPPIGESDFTEPFDSAIIGLRDLLCGYSPNPPELTTPVRAAGNLTRTLLFFAYQPDWNRVRMQTVSPCSAFFIRQILLCRPGNFRNCRLHAVFKGGSNREPGGHADVGSFIVVLDGVPMLVDPGAGMPDARCHSVPILESVVQRSGTNGSAEVTGQKFFNSLSEVAFDLAPLYRSVFGLQKLNRTCTYDRARDGSVTIRDEVNFRTPSRYESPVIAEGDVKIISPEVVEISRDGKRLRLSAEAGKLAVETELTPLQNSAGRKLVRISFRLKEPAKKFTLQLKAEPVDLTEPATL